jgi:predicted metalloprotease
LAWFGGTTTVLPGGATTVVFSVVPQADRTSAPNNISQIFDGMVLSSKELCRKFRCGKLVPALGGGGPGSGVRGGGAEPCDPGGVIRSRSARRRTNMRWEGGRQSGDIEDRRGLGPVGVGGIGVGGVVLALIGYFVFGINPSTTLQAVNGAGAPAQQQQQGVQGKVADKAGQFVDVVSTNVNDVWTQLFRDQGQTYRAPRAVVLYSEATGTGCGLGQSAMGPFFCPNDDKVYLDLSFWQELEGRFGATGDAAKAYVIAHEMGHHVQHLLGEDREAQAMGARGAASGSVRLELQADCYAGVWAAHAAQVSNGQVALDPSDIEDGLRAAAAVGDDTLQRATTGRVAPDSFTHGTSAQRTRWFRKGADSGDPAACDTFSAAQL